MAKSGNATAKARDLAERGHERFLALSEKFFSAAWPSYVLILLLQSKVIWRIWEFKDLTTGDTSSYATNAMRWRDEFAVNFIWSPLYTMFYGTTMMFSHDIFHATILHRVIIVMLATVGVLAIMRQLLPAGLALFIATWWAVMPINFDTLYEVHLFALLPILAAWLVAAKFDNAAGRGTALAILAGTTLMLRNEYIVAFVSFALVCAFLEFRALRLQERKIAALANISISYLVPLLLAGGLVWAVYSASYLKFPEADASLKSKHTLNMCQVYAFGYQQRHPEWALSPWLECYGLMKETFGNALPTMSEMIQSNPRAMSDHVLWNLSLLPSGLQVGLFNAMSGVVNPDYAHVSRTFWVLVPSLIFLGLAGAALTVIFRNRTYWMEDFFGPKRSVWLLLCCTLIVSIPVIITQRPRPSYLFTTTLITMAAIGVALHVLFARWPKRVAATCLFASLAALILVPPYYPSRWLGQPMRQAYERLLPFVDRMRSPGTKTFFGEYTGELRGYLSLRGKQLSTLDFDLNSIWKKTEPLQEFLQSEHVDIFIAAPALYASLRNEPLAQPLLSEPEKFGWQRLGPSPDKVQDWIIIARDPAK